MILFKHLRNMILLLEVVSIIQIYKFDKNNNI